MKLNSIQAAAETQFSKQSDRYGKSHILADVSDVRAAAELLPDMRGRDVLDVATGGGHTGLYFASTGAKVTLADLSQAMLDTASKLASERGLEITTACHPAETLPYQDGSFDLVTCRVAAHHFASPSAFVTESARLLRPGGHLLVIDGTAPDELPEAEEWIHAVEKLRDPSHNRFLTPASWRKLAEQAGLDTKMCTTNRLRQPNLQWYFETANTSPENREKVLALIADASPSIRDYFNLAVEGGIVSWDWPVLTLLCAKH